MENGVCRRPATCFIGSDEIRRYWASCFISVSGAGAAHQPLRVMRTTVKETQATLEREFDSPYSADRSAEYPAGEAVVAMLLQLL